jgi:dTDP-4-amino-4,6-dideoxygalactose transaminase
MNLVEKSKLEDLAIFGGIPAFKEKLHVGRPNLGDRERLNKRLEEILDRRWLTNNGVCVQEFEKRITEICGVKHCIAVCNGTIGLEIVTRALGWSGEVIIPGFTFVATAHSLRWQQIDPVFADVHFDTHNIDPDSAGKKITSKTTGIIGVHLWGQPCDIDCLKWLAKKYKLGLMFDAAHSFGCSFGGKNIGSFGDAEVFSFHATKFVNSLEGGAIVTNNDELAKKCRLMTNFGFLGFDNVGYVGTNGKMNEFSAAMGLTSLESMDRFVSINKVNHEHYSKKLGLIPGLTILDPGKLGQSNYQYIIMDVDPEIFPISRDNLLDILWSENVVARRYFYPGVHQMEPYRSEQRGRIDDLVNVNKISSRIIVLPTGQCVGSSDIDVIFEIINTSFLNYKRIHNKIGSSEFSVHKNILRDPLATN